MLNNFQLYNKQKYIYYDYFLLIRFLDKFNIRVTHCNFAFTVFIKRKKKIFLKNLDYFPTSSFKLRFGTRIIILQNIIIRHNCINNNNNC